MLERSLEAECEFIHVDVPMPPMGLLWLLNPFLAQLLAGLWWGVPWAFSWVENAAPLWVTGPSYVLTLAAVVVYVRVSVALIVRFAVWHGRTSCAYHIQRWDPELLMGFSWGAGVLHKLLRSRTQESFVHSRPVLLLAPTSTSMASIAMEETWPLSGVCDSRVDVVEAAFDHFSSKAQTEVFTKAGCRILTVQDGHTLTRPSTLSILGGRVLALLHA